MKFSNEELAILNQMIGVALLSGKIEFNEDSKSVHRKITSEIMKRGYQTKKEGLKRV